MEAPELRDDLVATLDWLEALEALEDTLDTLLERRELVAEDLESKDLVVDSRSILKELQIGD